MITSPFYLINPIVIENLKLFFKGTIIKINPLNSKIKEIFACYLLVNTNSLIIEYALFVSLF
jgi:hypothetical protein